MARGLGRIERAILTAMVRDDDIELWQRDQLVQFAFDLTADERPNWRPTRAEQEAVNRAVRSLIRKGLICQIDFPRGLCYDITSLSDEAKRAVGCAPASNTPGLIGLPILEAR